MSKKDFDMSQLVSGLTGEQEEKNENRRSDGKAQKADGTCVYTGFGGADGKSEVDSRT